MKNPFTPTTACTGPRCFIEAKTHQGWLRVGDGILAKDAAPRLFCCHGSAADHIESALAKFTLAVAIGAIPQSQLENIQQIRITEIDQEPAILDSPVGDVAQAQGLLEQIRLKP